MSHILWVIKFKTRLRPKYSNMCNRRNVLKAALIFGNSILNQSKIFLAVLLQFFDFKPSWYTTLQLCNKYKDRVYQDIICSFEKSDNSQKNDTFFKRMYNTISKSVQYICQYFNLILSGKFRILKIFRAAKINWNSLIEETLHLFEPMIERNWYRMNIDKTGHLQFFYTTLLR